MVSLESPFRIPEWIAAKRGETGVGGANGKRHETRPAQHEAPRALRETAEGTSLNRSVGALDLTAFGIGAIIGTGIFVIVGEAIASVRARRS